MPQKGGYQRGGGWGEVGGRGAQTYGHQASGSHTQCSTDAELSSCTPEDDTVLLTSVTPNLIKNNRG